MMRVLSVATCGPTQWMASSAITGVWERENALSGESQWVACILEPRDLAVNW